MQDWMNPQSKQPLIDMNKSKCKPPLDEKEVRSIAKSVGKYPASAKSGDKKAAEKPKLTGYFENLIDIVLDKNPINDLPCQRERGAIGG